MKKLTYTYLSALLVLVFSCKNDSKNSKDENNTATQTVKAEKEDEESIGLEEPEIDLEELMGTMGGLLTKEEDTTNGQKMFKDGKLNFEYLKSDAGKPMRKFFAKVAEVTEEEVELVLTLPTINSTCSEKQM